MQRRRILVAVVVMCTGVACQPANQRAGATKQSVHVSVVDEQGKPITTAVMRAIGNTDPIEIPGTRELKIDQPVAGTIEANTYLPEPFVIDPADVAVTVRLFNRVGPSGAERLSLQFGGDVMMGRRYQQPEGRTDTPIATTDAGARTVVRHIAPIMAAADVSTVNLETVVGQLPETGAYPAKRFLLQSPPVVLAALDEMGIDLVTLGNNHAYDWQGPGVTSTIASLDGAGIAWAGAGTSEAQAQAGRMIDVRQAKVGVVSATTVNGDFVNDNLPGADETRPVDLPAKDAWQYEERTFGFGKVGDAEYVPAEPRRPGVAWTAFTELESLLDDQQSGALWGAMAKAYPELQDWVARRGHGGAAPFQSEAIKRSITELRADGADLVVVEIHGGFQFSDVASEFATRAAHAAIDAGADLVVGHHPHVLQGFEWYKGRLIAYSLGNFVFDQDFLSTFPSAILRTIFEGNRMIDARVIPLTIDRYQPVPVAGASATRVIRLMNSRSALTAYSDRIAPRIVESVIDTHLPGNATLTDNGMAGEITDQRTSESVEHQLDDNGLANLPPCTIVKTGSFEGDIGVDLLQWGDLDDATADRESAGATQWTFTGNATTAVEGSNYFLRLQPSKVRGASARQIARSTTPLHRWFDSSFNPVDGDPTYSVQMRTRGTGVVGATLRIAVYDVNDTDPTTEPVSTLLNQTDIPLPVHDAKEWSDLDLDVSAIVNATVGDLRPNALLLYVVLPSASPRLDVDDVQLMEWRRPQAGADGVWVPADAVRGAARSTLSVEESGCVAPTG
jgi:poly-gamma-glutamate capsule biosynthesis protein CapA/YwtB (metallophosphatase superfamily)